MKEVLKLLDEFDYKISDSTIYIYHMMHVDSEEQIKLSRLRSLLPESFKIILI